MRNNLTTYTRIILV